MTSVVTPALTSIHIRNLRVIPDRFKLLEMMPATGVVAELGVDRGNYSAAILRTTRPRKLHLIDCWDSDRFGEAAFIEVRNRFRDELRRGRVVIQRGYSWKELDKLPNDYLDWVYVDTSHSYEHTVRELELSRQKLKFGGLISGHDYTTGNIARSITYGVIQAVNEFCVKYQWEMIFLTNEPGRYLTYVLRAM